MSLSQRRAPSHEPLASSRSSDPLDELADLGSNAFAQQALQGRAEPTDDLAGEGLGGGEPLPYQTELEDAFGQRLGHLRAHFGPQANAAARAMGAEAYTAGSDLVFAEPNPSKELVAHEVTHGLQQTGDVNASSDRSLGESSDEAEAESAAAAVAAGGSVEVSGNGSTGVRRSPGDPAPMHDADGDATTSHAAIDPADHYSATGASFETLVRVIHTETDPIVGPDAPATEDLYEQISDPVASEPGFTQVSGIAGSVSDPNEKRVASTDQPTLFLDGGPSMQDVAQGGLGDCFFLAVVQAMMQSDPGQIESSIQGDHAGAAATFFHLAATPAPGTPEHWLPQSYAVSNTIIVDADQDPHGASVRVADEPVSSSWYAKILPSGQLAVVRKDEFELALWAPMLEKAFAAFAQEHGGDGRAAAPAASGYEVIDGGGFGQDVYPIFYGESAQIGQDSIATTMSGDNPITANLDAVRRLAAFAHQGADDPERLMLTVSLQDTTAVDRVILAALDANIRLLQRQASADHTVFWWETDDEEALRTDRVEDMQRAVTDLKTKAQAWRDAPDADQPSKIPDLAAASALLTDGSWPLMERPEYAGLLQQALITQNLGDDESSGRRGVYALHEYTVLAVNLLRSDGTGFSGDAASLTAGDAANLDANTSSVTLRNPHGTNEPDRAGDGADDGQDNGQFNMSLGAFLSSFDTLAHGIVHR